MKRIKDIINEKTTADAIPSQQVPLGATRKFMDKPCFDLDNETFIKSVEAIKFRKGGNWNNYLPKHIVQWVRDTKYTKSFYISNGSMYYKIK